MPSLRQGGIALVLVLWTIALLSIVAASFAFSIRTETRLAQNLIEQAKAEALAEAGIELGILQLLAQMRPKSSPEGMWRVDGTPYEVAVGEDLVRVVLESEVGKINLNLADETLIRGLASSVAGEDAPRLADRLLDWRDDDNVRRPDGAEDTDYWAAQYPYGARDGALKSMSEVAQVLEVAREESERLRLGATVYSRQAKLDPVTATRAALLGVPGLDASTVDRYLAEREQRIAEGLEPPVNLLSAGEEYFLLNASTSSYAAGNVYTVRSRGVSRSGVVVELGVVVQMRGSQRQPFRVLAWSDSTEDVDPAEDR